MPPLRRELIIKINPLVMELGTKARWLLNSHRHGPARSLIAVRCNNFIFSKLTILASNFIFNKSSGHLLLERRFVAFLFAISIEQCFS